MSQHFYNTFYFQLWLVLVWYFIIYFKEILYSKYFHKKIIDDKLLLILKLDITLLSLFYLSIVAWHLGFVMKWMWKFCGLHIFFFYKELRLSNCENIVTTTKFYNIFTINLFLVVVSTNFINFYFILSYEKLTL